MEKWWYNPRLAKQAVAKNRCFWTFWPNSTIFGGRISPKNVKRHIYTPRPFIWAYYQDPMTNRYKETAWKSSCFGGRIWPKLSKSTSKRQDLSYEPIPRSLRPSLTKIQPGKESMTDGPTDRNPKSIGPKPLCCWLTWPNSPPAIGRLWPKLSKGTYTRQDISFENMTKSLWPSVQKVYGHVVQESDDRRTYLKIFRLRLVSRSRSVKAKFDVLVNQCSELPPS